MLIIIFCTYDLHVPSFQFKNVLAYDNTFTAYASYYDTQYT